MRTLLTLLTGAGCIASGTAIAQGAGNGAPDFSGIYKGATTIVEPEVYPLTVTGEQAHAAYDPLTGDPRQTDDCAPESMPSILWAGTLNTIQIEAEAERIVMTLEHGGTVRSIHTNGVGPSAAQPGTELGYSAGRWEDDVLIVETTHLLGGVVFTNRGYPVSSRARLTERYWREGGNSLQMQLTLEDPENYTETVTLEREWIWAPEEQIVPWECFSLGPRDAEPDIDELRRLLNPE